MHSPPADVKKLNIIPARPRLPDLQSLRKRNKAEGILLDAAIDRYRSTALTASLSLPQSTRPRNSQVCGLQGTLLSSPSKTQDTPRTELRKQRKLNRHTLPGLNSIEEIRKRLSPISTPTSKWGFILKQDPAHEIRTPKMGSQRQRSSTLSAISVTPTASGKEENITEKKTCKMTNAAEKESRAPIERGANNADVAPSGTSYEFQISNTKRRVRNAQASKKMNSNQKKFVESLDKVASTEECTDHSSRLGSPISKSRPKELLTYKKKAPPPLLTLASIKQKAPSSGDMETGITLNTDGSFISNFSNGSPSIWL